VDVLALAAGTAITLVILLGTFDQADEAQAIRFVRAGKY
jgi:hypothetical protein